MTFGKNNVRRYYEILHFSYIKILVRNFSGKIFLIFLKNLQFLKIFRTKKSNSDVSIIYPFTDLKYQICFLHKNLVRTFLKNLQKFRIRTLWYLWTLLMNETNSNSDFNPFSLNTNLIFSRKIWFTRLLMNEVQLYKLE